MPIRRKRIDRELLRDHAAHVSELARRLASCAPRKPFTSPSLALMLQDRHRAVIRPGEAAYGDVPTEIGRIAGPRLLTREGPDAPRSACPSPRLSRACQPRARRGSTGRLPREEGP